jgi:hypothetical protein
LGFFAACSAIFSIEEGKKKKKKKKRDETHRVEDVQEEIRADRDLSCALQRHCFHLLDFLWRVLLCRHIKLILRVR